MDSPGLDDSGHVWVQLAKPSGVLQQLFKKPPVLTQDLISVPPGVLVALNQRKLLGVGGPMKLQRVESIPSAQEPFPNSFLQDNATRYRRPHDGVEVLMPDLWIKRHHAVLAKLHQWQLDVPDALKGALSKIIVNPWEKIGSQTAAASAGRDILNFYEGDRNILSTHPVLDTYYQKTHYHENGHLFAHKRFGTPTPHREYGQAVQADKRSVSKYGDTHIEEDFAEFFAEYIQAMKLGGATWQNLHRQYPHRARFFDALIATPKS